MLKSLASLKERIRANITHTMVVVFAHDELVLDAIRQAKHYCQLHTILIGNADEIRSIAKTISLEIEDVIHETDPVEATKIAMLMIREGRADFVMKGLIDTKYLLGGVVNHEYGIKEQKYLSHVGLVEVPGFDRVLFATDGAMMISPTVEEKIAIVQNAVALAHALGYVKPCVGLVSSVEKVNPKIPSTMDAQAVVQYFNEHPLKAWIDGPFAIDNLVSEESTKHKGIVSPVAGKADILVFPNLDGGNIFYKTSVFLAKGDSAGLVMGASVPIIVTSRADTMNAKLNSILLAVVMQDGLSSTRN